MLDVEQNKKTVLITLTGIRTCSTHVHFINTKYKLRSRPTIGDI